MPRKRHSAEQIVNKLREADVLISQGQSIAHVCKQIGITDQTYYRWRKEYGGLNPRYYSGSSDIEARVIPCGVYYVVPESFRANGLQTGLLDLVEQDLASPNALINIEVKADAPVDAQIDLVECYTRIVELMETLGETRQPAPPFAGR